MTLQTESAHLQTCPTEEICSNCSLTCEVPRWKQQSFENTFRPLHLQCQVCEQQETDLAEDWVRSGWSSGSRDQRWLRLTQSKSWGMDSIRGKPHLTTKYDCMKIHIDQKWWFQLDTQLSKSSWSLNIIVMRCEESRSGSKDSEMVIEPTRHRVDPTKDPQTKQEQPSACLTMSTLD